MGSFYESMYAANRRISVPSMDGGKGSRRRSLTGGLVQRELDFSGQSGDGTMKPASQRPSHTVCHAKIPERCPYHGVPASIVSLLKDGEPGTSPDGKAKMADYVRTLRRWLSLIPRQNEQEQLRAFLDLIDDGRHAVAMRLFKEETSIRSIRDNERRNDGEWM